MKCLTSPLKSEERGSALVEFCLCFALFWMPVFGGTFYTGFNVLRAMQVTQVCRDAAHMFASGTDFSQAPQQNLLISLAPTISWTATSGNAVIVLSRITYVDSTDCKAAGLPPNPNRCPNINQTVFTRQVIVGNKAFHSSALGTPNSNILDSSGNIDPSYYLSDSSARANFSGTVPLQSGQVAYVAEMWGPPWWAGASGTGPSARSIF